MLVDAWNGQWEACFLIKNTFSQKHLRCLGSRLGSRLPQGERYGVLDGDGKEGKKEGRKEGKEEGEEKEGREEGREEGEEKEGREEGRKGGRKGGRKRLQIACGELRWEGARQHAGRTGNRANRLRRALLGGSETACWRDRKPCK